MGDLKNLEAEIKVESVPLCPVCRSKGRIVFDGCFDAVFGIPGSWTYQKCLQCDSLWMDPRPIKEMIQILYPDDYLTHVQPSELLKPPEGFLEHYRFGVKLSILEDVYGYRNLSKRPSLFHNFILRKLLRFLPRINGRVGYAVRFLHFSPGGRLLDVGCGNGTFLRFMKELGWEVKGIEPDLQAARIASSQGLNVAHCNLEQVELEPYSYDAITLHHVLEHLSDPNWMLKKLVRYLKPGGVLVIISPNPDGLMARWFGVNWRGLEPPRHFVIPSPKAYELIFQNIGLKIKMWTITYSDFWRYRESLGIQKFGKAKSYRGWVIPKLFSLLSSMVVPLFHFVGDEIVCVGTKG
jgi:2-polyprenyl-3-methyl-5-hydroxy-6-metoxy-1,4-benzoquinol methylase